MGRKWNKQRKIERALSDLLDRVHCETEEDKEEKRRLDGGDT